jgi:pSer/pThr/pTyr-binding forkhead associated (FHA) protein
MSGEVVLVLRLLLALALYGFLTLALRMMWLELRQNAGGFAKNEAPVIRLEVRVPRQSPVVRAYSRQELVVGRNPHADVHIADHNVSPRHAALVFRRGQWWISDLGSAKGTWLNRAKLAGPALLVSGDEIKCGHARVIVTVGGPPSRRPARGLRAPHA